MKIQLPSPSASDLQLIRGEPTLLIGTSVPFTAPANAVSGLIAVSGMSTNGTSIPLIQIGDEDGIEPTGYNSAGGYSVTSTLSSVPQTTGFGLAGNVTAATILNLNILLVRANPLTNTWNMSIGGGNTNPVANYGGGTKSLSKPLTGGRFITVNNTDQYDAGYFTTMWWVKP